MRNHRSRQPPRRDRPSRQYLLRLLRDDFETNRLIGIAQAYKKYYDPNAKTPDQQRFRDEVSAGSPDRASLIHAIRGVENNYYDTNIRAYKAVGGNVTVLPSIGYFLGGIFLAKGIDLTILDTPEKPERKTAI